MRIKVSRYSMFVPREDDHIIAVNTLYKTVALIKREQAGALQRILAAPNQHLHAPEGPPALLKGLRRGLFLVDEELDELEFLKMRSLQGKFGTEELAVGLMPTLRCNFGCRYCYVSPQSPDMPEDMQQSILTWLGTRRFRHLTCGWFGGEPTLRLDVMRTMTAAMQELCHDQGSTFSNMMSTNGYLLTPAVIRELEQDLGFTSLQITLDGPREVHDRQRPLKGGQGTFDVIYENAANVLALTENINLSLRINVSEDNLDAAYELVDQLAPEFKSPRVRVYLKVTWPHPGCWEDQDTSDEGRAARNALSRRVLQFHKDIAQRGFGTNFVGTFGVGGCIKCEGDYYHYFLIGPEGNLYKCTVSFEVGERFGYLTPEGRPVLDLPRLTQRMAKDPFTDPQCSECQLLPLCGGWCVYNDTLGHRSCYPLDWGITPEDVAEMLYLEERGRKKGGAAFFAGRH